MNTETPTTAAELLAEWKTLNALNETATTRSLFMAPHLVSHMAAIAARLDELCEDAGIEIIRMGASQGYFFSYSRWTNLDSIKIQAKPYLVAREQQALQEWLLIKNENGK